MMALRLSTDLDHPARNSTKKSDLDAPVKSDTDQSALLMAVIGPARFPG